MYFSKTFIIRDVKEMGLSFSTEPFSSFLCTGATEASFHSFVILPVTKDILNIIVNGFAKVDAQFFNTMPCISSGLAVLLGFISLRRRRTSSS